VAAFGLVLVLTPIFIYSERISERPEDAARQIPWRPWVKVRANSMTSETEPGQH
jgi:hypothetical protein